jgi:hypothetical protein
MHNIPFVIRLEKVGSLFLHEVTSGTPPTPMCCSASLPAMVLKSGSSQETLPRFTLPDHPLLTLCQLLLLGTEYFSQAFCLTSFYYNDVEMNVGP